jgi:hypothetical protein
VRWPEPHGAVLLAALQAMWLMALHKRPAAAERPRRKTHGAVTGRFQIAWASFQK